MDTSLILLSSFIVLTGLKLCDAEKGTIEKMADQASLMCPWIRSPRLKIIYGLLQLTGVVYVLGMVVYLTFMEHWWYTLVYIVGLILAIITSFFLKVCLIPIFNIAEKRSVDIDFAALRVRRFIGTLFIVIGIILFFGLNEFEF